MAATDKIEVNTFQDEADAVEQVELAKLGVAIPSNPGDILLCGNLPREAVGQVAKLCKGWIYLNEEGDANFFRAEIEAAGAKLELLPFLPPSVSEARVKELDAAIDALPRPLMLQCKSGNRAGAAMLLWLAHRRGYSAQSAVQLAVDLDLQFFTRCATCGPVREWLLEQLPKEGDTNTAVLDTGAVVQQLFDPDTSTLTYVVGCRASGEAVLIDPVLEQRDRDLHMIDELGFRLTSVINTHCHADHVTSGGAIRKDRPEVKTIISADSGAKADRHVKHGERIAVGKLELEVRATPGHTDGCVCFLLAVPRQPPMVFTGDALLIRGCGRCDFQQGDAGKLYDSVHAQVFSLPPETLVYPGHDYKGRSVSTVAEEKQFNPRLSKTREEFVELMANLGLPYPKRIDVAVPANMVCGVQD
jgi:sulfur dioxygenase